MAYRELGASRVHHGLTWFLCFSFILVSRASATPDLARSSKYHLDLSSFRYMVGASPSLGVFYLYERAILAIRPVTACGLVTTFGISIRCNIAIRPESIHCELMTRGQVFVCCSATTLGIVVHCDITIISESIRYVLVGIRLLPIYRSHFR